MFYRFYDRYRSFNDRRPNPFPFRFYCECSHPRDLVSILNLSTRGVPPFEISQTVKDQAIFNYSIGSNLYRRWQFAIRTNLLKCFRMLAESEISLCKARFVRWNRRVAS